ncbi:MAG: type III pantothenate kinase [Tannerellaceae bacterium]|nr:type III pantothenate kinase [Tannerellaceae bacterium]
MNLIIEQGNTQTKVAIYDKGCQKASFAYKSFHVADIVPLFERYPLVRGILSTVIDRDEEVNAFLRERLHDFLFLDETTSLPVRIGYQTPATLGRDRLAAVVAANYLQPEKDILVIDAGTAITYELIEASGLFLGGNISPGMTTRFKALHDYTKKLPLIAEKEDVPFVGTSTETAILAGVVNGIVYEMDGYIHDLRIKYPNLLVFLTGGHSFYFERRLKNRIFANINLVLIGLNRILEYNVEN